MEKEKRGRQKNKTSKREREKTVKKETDNEKVVGALPKKPAGTRFLVLRCTEYRKQMCLLIPFIQDTLQLFSLLISDCDANRRHGG